MAVSSQAANVTNKHKIGWIKYKNVVKSVDAVKIHKCSQSSLNFINLVPFTHLLNGEMQFEQKANKVKSPKK